MPNYLNRLRLLSAIFVLSALVLGGRLFHLQVIGHEDYSDRADRQYQRPSEPVPDRGTIFFTDRDGQRFSAAVMQTGFILAINPLRLEDPEETYQQLSAVVALDRENFFAKAAKPDDPYEELAAQVSESEAERIGGLRLPGVILQRTRWRVYPAGKLASHVIGLMAWEGDEFSGRYGLERQFNQILERESGQSFIGFLADLLSELKGVVAGPGDDSEAADLVLTIEPQVSQTLEAELVVVLENYQAPVAGGIIMDPQTGEILAMAALPNFDPGNKISDIAVLPNPLVESVFEMGSIVKPLTMAAALDAGVVTASSTYTDLGYVSIDNRRIENYDGKGRGLATMQDVLSFSLNTGAVFAMQQLGPESLRHYFESYGLGSETDIDLPGELAGLTENLSSGREVEYATASFGQGFAVTPIAITRALAVLANGGRLVTPHVVKSLERSNTGLSEKVQFPAAEQILDPATSREITRMLVEVVDTQLAGGKVKQANYQVAAKTGTAQLADPAGGYYADQYLHSFFGYLPASQPRFIIFLYLLKPQGVRYSSETLTTPFVNLSKFLINYYQLPPDR
ncbi:MAG: penicillin-binding protein 2 [Patescibacteria group bacterium]|nr:penicillin-binding protein 2 [Patescibacteria group bacterium]